MLWDCHTQYASKFGKLSSDHRTGKGQFSFQSLRKAMSKKAQTTTQLHSSHTLVKECSKFSKPGFNSTWTMKFQKFKLVLEKAEEPEIKLPTSTGSWRKQESSRKTSTSALLTMPKPLTVWITTNCRKFLKRWNTRPPYLWNLYACQKTTVKTGHGTTDWFQIRKRVHQSCILWPCLFNLYAEYIMWNAGLDEAQAGIKIVRRSINNLRYADDTTLRAEGEEELDSLLMKVKEESKTAGLKLNIQKTKIMAFSPIISWQIDAQIIETVTVFLFLGSRITADGDWSHEIKRLLLLGRKAMTNLDSILKSRDITLSTRSIYSRLMVFPVGMYGCESWTIKKAECQRIDAFELWCWRRLLRASWTARRSNQSILKEISPWIFIGRTDAEAETPILWPPDVKNWLIRKDPDERLKAGGEGDDRGQNGWMAKPATQWTWVWANSRRWWRTGNPGML